MDGTIKTTFTIRPAVADDYLALVKVWNASGLKASPTGRDRESSFREQVVQFRDSYLVACQGQEIIGVVLGTHDSRKGWINRLAVLPEWRRSGVATELIRACEKALVDRGIGIVTALVEPENEASCGVFATLGYADYPIKYFRKVIQPGA